MERNTFFFLVFDLQIKFLYCINYRILEVLLKLSSIINIVGKDIKVMEIVLIIKY